MDGVGLRCVASAVVASATMTGCAGALLDHECLSAASRQAGRDIRLHRPDPGVDERFLVRDRGPGRQNLVYRCMRQADGTVEVEQVPPAVE